MKQNNVSHYSTSHNNTRYLENQAIEWLAKLNNPNLSDEDEQAFQQWLSQSPAHQLAYIKAEELWELSEKAVSLDKPSYAMPWRYAFASLLLVLCGSWFYFSPEKFEAVDYITAIGEQKEFLLADGSRVKLNNQSHIRFAQDNKSRTVFLLKGEALFDVVSNPSKPFDVDTEDGVVRVVGTQFSVNRYDASTLVTVVEGRVALGKKPSSPEKFIAAQVLTAAQQQSIAEALAGAKPKVVNPDNELAWQQQRLIYQGVELTKVIRDLERIYPVTFELDNSASLGKRKVTAVLNLTSLDQVLKVLEASLSLESTRENSVIRLSEKK